jgi:hypothetical protein
MKKSFILKTLAIILLISFNTISSQEKVIKGLVLDSLETPIQYANIGVLNKPIGTVSNIKGEFILNIDNSYILDTLKISSLSFKSKEFVIKDLYENSNLTIYLENYTEELEEVVISSNNLKTYTKGKEKTKTKNEVLFATPEIKNINLGSQIGRKFSIGKKKSSLLKEFMFYIKKNNFEKIKFRINIYNINKNIPLKRINEIDIYTDVENITGWVKVNLTDYDITVKEDIIITIEWIEASKVGDTLSLPIFVPSFSSIHYYKQSAQAKWRKYKMISSAMVLTYKQEK